MVCLEGPGQESRRLEGSGISRKQEIVEGCLGFLCRPKDEGEARGYEQPLWSLGRSSDQGTLSSFGDCLY